MLLAGALVGTFLTGLYAFRLYFVLFRGEPSAELRARYHDHHGKEGPAWMTIPVLILALLGVVGGLVQFSPIWHPLADWLDPVAEPLVEATGTVEAVVSIAAVALGLCGILVAWLVYVRGRIAVPALPKVRRTLEEKFWFDWLYDRIFYLPADWFARALDRYFERPVIGGSIIGVERGTDEVSGLVSRFQTGFVRMYAVAFATGLAVLAVVFISVR